MEKFGGVYGMEKALLSRFFSLEMKRHGPEKRKSTGISNTIFLFSKLKMVNIATSAFA